MLKEAVFEALPTTESYVSSAAQILHAVASYLILERMASLKEDKLAGHSVHPRRATRSLSLDDKTVDDSEKQAVRFRADIPHAYRNLSESKCVVYDTIFYPSY